MFGLRRRERIVHGPFLEEVVRGTHFSGLGPIFGCTTEPLGRFLVPGICQRPLSGASFFTGAARVAQRLVRGTCLTECQAQPPCEWAGADEMFGKVLIYDSKAAKKGAFRAHPETCWEEQK